MRGWILALVLWLGGVGHAQLFEEPAFVEVPCPFLIWAPEVEGETILCGTVNVPESWYGRSDGVVTLMVAILKTAAQDPVAPIIYLEGGPGASAIAGVHSWLNSTLRKHADVILFDQRGTGHSRPSLNCFEADDDSLPTDLNPEEMCRDRLIAEGVVLEAYNSAESAADVAALIEALGLEEATLYGVSYGTRLALTVMRDFPERIRSVILDSVFPPHVNGLDEQVVNGARAFDVLFRDCEASRSCNTAYPALRSTFLRMIDDLNRRPMVNDEGKRIKGDDVVNELFKLMYDTTALPYLPAAITAAANRDVDAYLEFTNARVNDWTVQLEQMTDDELNAYIAEFLSFESVEAYLLYVNTLNDEQLLALLDAVYSIEPPRSPAEREALDARLMELLGVDTPDELLAILRTLDDAEYYALISEAYGDIDSDSEGVFNSVKCYEEVPFNSPRVAERLAQEVPNSLAKALFLGVEYEFATCDMWGVDAADAFENDPVASEIPVLVLSGEYDPITPPAWGQTAADYLPNSRHFVFPGMGHGLIDVIGFPCPTSIVVQFLRDPFTPLDDSCVTRMGPPAFYVE